MKAVLQLVYGPCNKLIFTHRTRVFEMSNIKQIIYKTYSKYDFIGNFFSFLSNLYPDTITSCALKGAVNAVAEFAKQNPADASQMGIKIAQSAGIKQEYGLAFASGFLGTARFEKSEQKS